MRKMTPEETRAFLLAETRTGKLATTRADGRPHVAPIWFTLDGEDIVFTTGAESVKGKSLQRDQRASLCVDDDTPPYAFVIIEGTVTLSEEPAALLHWATVLGGRYMGAEQAAAYGQRNGVPGELLVRLTPIRVLAQAGIADW